MKDWDWLICFMIGFITARVETAIRNWLQQEDK